MKESSEEDPLLLLAIASPNDISCSRHVKDLYILSASFFFIFSAYGAIQTLESSLNSDGGLGSISLGVLHISLSIFSVGASVIVKRVGSKLGILLGFTGYWIYLVANMFPNWYTMISASIFVGLTGAFTWVAQGSYITSAAKAHAVETKLDEVGVIGKFNGTFWGIYATTQVFGNLLTLWLLQVDEESTSTHESSSTSTWLLMFTFLGAISIGTFLAFFLRRQEQYSSKLSDDLVQGSPSFCGHLHSAVSILTQKNMLLLLPLLIYNGFERAFMWDDFTENIIAPSLGISWIGGVMAANGVADAICSWLAGHASSSISSISVLLSGAAVTHLFALIFLAFKQSYESNLEGYLAIFGLAIMWGFGHAIVNSQISALLGTLFPLQMEAAFAQWKVWQCASAALIFILSSWTAFALRLVLLFMMLPLCAISLCFLRHSVLNPTYAVRTVQ